MQLVREHSGPVMAEPLWTDPGLKSGISVRKLISTFFFFQAQVEKERLNLLLKSLQMRKSHN